MTNLGIDPSAIGQGAIDWTAVSSTVAFSVCKATEGLGFIDGQLAANVKGAVTRGIDCSAYHFLRSGSGSAQFDHYWSAIKPYSAHIRGIALDVEVSGAGGAVIGFLDRMKQVAPGIQCAIYSNHGLWGMSGGPDLSGYNDVAFEWHAGYINGAYSPVHGSLAAEWNAIASKTNPTPFAGLSRILMVQFTDHASVPGIAGGVDGDAWIGTDAQYAAFFNATVATPVYYVEDDMTFYVSATDGAPAITDASGKLVNEAVAQGAVLEVNGLERNWVTPEAWNGEDTAHVTGLSHRAIPDPSDPAHKTITVPVEVKHYTGKLIQAQWPVTTATRLPTVTSVDVNALATALAAVLPAADSAAIAATVTASVVSELPAADAAAIASTFSKKLG